MSKFVPHAWQRNHIDEAFLIVTTTFKYALRFKEVIILGGKEAISFFVISEAKHIWEKISDLHLIRKLLFHSPPWHLCVAYHNIR